MASERMRDMLVWCVTRLPKVGEYREEKERTKIDGEGGGGRERDSPRRIV